MEELGDLSETKGTKMDGTVRDISGSGRLKQKDDLVPLKTRMRHKLKLSKHKKQP